MSAAEEGTPPEASRLGLAGEPPALIHARELAVAAANETAIASAAVGGVSDVSAGLLAEAAAAAAAAAAEETVSFVKQYAIRSSAPYLS